METTLSLALRAGVGGTHSMEYPAYPSWARTAQTKQNEGYIVLHPNLDMFEPCACRVRERTTYLWFPWGKRLHSQLCDL